MDAPKAASASAAAASATAAASASASTLPLLDRRVGDCRACPRLVAWREEVARTKRAAFADWTYWGRPVPGFGPPDARLLIVGLAPAAHGGNRTGRMFTGDRSGDVLYQALYDVGLASQPTAVSIDDGLELYGVRITAPVHCAPPANKPTPGERDTCRPWLVQELRLLRPTLRAVVVLGAFGWQAALPAFAEAGWTVPRPRPAFGHGTRVPLGSLPRSDGAVDAVGPNGTASPDSPNGTPSPDSPNGTASPDSPDGNRSPDGMDSRDSPNGTLRPDGPGGNHSPESPDGTDTPGGIRAQGDPGGAGRLDVFGCFHVSQRNTFTGRLTPAMLRDVLRTAAGAAGLR